MARDAGARQILDLLDQPSETLAVNAERLAKALQLDRNNPNTPAPDEAYKAIKKIRGYYSGLRDDVAKVRTNAHRGKSDVIDGLDDLDTGYEAYAKGLRSRSTAAGVNAMKKAQKTTSAATRKLSDGRGRL